MNLPYEALNRIMALLRWVLDNKTDENDFVRNVFYAFQPFYNLRETLNFCEDQATVTIPFSLAADLNSIVIQYSGEWNFMTGGE
ncbi:hypothetical protein Acj61p020 [Acinetobacter phage Acj61]|uniref:Uncharacterized protein n=1 Tax=Acinetobacter phage Acj61 TaxID=760732 RepID=E5E401_9CAUD|nr:hypothetical protein Acj61p020 [Acinetobacter phage Acj61]ADG35985.1 hypothetical protein Acj61p020 [Acinetobacter phage Acj61]